MAISYEEALGIIQKVAQQCSQRRGGSTQTFSLLESLGRVAAKDHASPVSTPPKDTSAMDGYAISSKATINASTENPVTFVVKGTIAAGDKPIELANELEDGAFPCVEIMTGAQFPHSSSITPFDACIKIEDTVPLGSLASGPKMQLHKRIAVTRSLPFHANRRFAGEDMRKGDVILAEGATVCSRHVMALASVGITEIVTYRKLRVGMWSTGNELSEGTEGVRNDAQILNSNGPFLVAALRELGVDVEYNGILRDEEDSLQTALGSHEVKKYDLVVTTGAVSKGKFDFIVPALEELRAEVHFHGVAMRPGHPVLFATTSNDTGNVPLFGLPGNPIATAACFRFLVAPFVRNLLEQAPEKPEPAGLLQRNGYRPPLQSSPAHLDCFRHGIVRNDDSGKKTVELSSNQSVGFTFRKAAQRK
jgi:molybdopterin molybdotransferase